MGQLVSKGATPQVLIIGPEGSGKTTALYKQKLKGGATLAKFAPTEGFQYEQERLPAGTDGEKVCGFWDVGGGKSSQMILSAITSNVRFNAVLCVIDISEDVVSVHGGVKVHNNFGNSENRLLSPTSTVDEARKQIHRVMAQDEMCKVHTLAILLNCRRDSPLHA